MVMGIDGDDRAEKYGGNSGVGVCGDVEFTELVELVDMKFSWWGR